MFSCNLLHPFLWWGKLFWDSFLLLKWSQKLLFVYKHMAGGKVPPAQWKNVSARTTLVNDLLQARGRWWDLFILFFFFELLISVYWCLYLWVWMCLVLTPAYSVCFCLYFVSGRVCVCVLSCVFLTGKCVCVCVVSRSCVFMCRHWGVLWSVLSGCHAAPAPPLTWCPRTFASGWRPSDSPS